MSRKRILALLLLLSLAAPAGAAAELRRYETSFMDVFDTFSQAIVVAESQEVAQEALQAAHDELKACHRLYDIYHSYEGVNNLRVVNESAGVAPVEVDDALFELMWFCREICDATDGKTNVAMGSVLRLWHERREAATTDPETAALPDGEALREAGRHTAIQSLQLDPEKRTVYLTDPESSLDVGAVAKGFAVERAARKLQELGVQGALLSVGGNVRALGLREDGTPWRAGVQNPDLTAENQSLTVVSLRDLSLVSSGSYQRYYTVAGKQYHHIIDPETLFPAERHWAVTVATEDSGLADALSTALFILSYEEGLELLKQWEGAEALWVEKDGSILRSDGFAALTAEEP